MGWLLPVRVVSEWADHGARPHASGVNSELRRCAISSPTRAITRSLAGRTQEAGPLTRVIDLTGKAGPLRRSPVSSERPWISRR